MRPVRRLKPDVPRDLFRQDLLYSFGAFMTVCEISRNDALRRVEAILKAGKDPGYESGVACALNGKPPDHSEGDRRRRGGRSRRNRAGSDRAACRQRVHGSYLLDSNTAGRRNPQGPGIHGKCFATRPRPKHRHCRRAWWSRVFESPRLVVQVKSGNVIADQRMLQALIGAVQDTHADQGLLVCWEGFKKPVETRQLVVLLSHPPRPARTERVPTTFSAAYHRLPEEFLGELPLWCTCGWSFRKMRRAMRDGSLGKP